MGGLDECFKVFPKNFCEAWVGPYSKPLNKEKDEKVNTTQKNIQEKKSKPKITVQESPACGDHGLDWISTEILKSKKI